MAWARLDDRFHEDPQLRRLYKTEPRAALLYITSLTYASGRETDGVVHLEFVETLEPLKAGRMKRARILVDLDWWREHPEGWEITNFLKYNPSRAEVEARREARKQAGARGGKASKRQAAAKHASQANAQALAYPADSPVPKPVPKPQAPISILGVGTNVPRAEIPEPGEVSF